MVDFSTFHGNKFRQWLFFYISRNKLSRIILNSRKFLLERKFLPTKVSSREFYYLKVVKILNISRKIFITTTPSPASFGPNFKNPFSMGKILAMLPYSRLSDSPDSLTKPLHVDFSSMLNCKGSNYIGGGVDTGHHFFKSVCGWGGEVIINWN